MKEHYRIPSLIFYAVTAAMVTVSVIAFACAISWVNKSFPGFLVYNPGYVGSFNSRDWQGKQQGIKTYNRILAVDGQSVLDGQSVVDAVRQKAVGTPVRYDVESKGEINEIIVPVDLFEIKDFLVVFFVTFLGGFIIYSFGIIVFFLKPNIKVSWVFLASSFSLGTYMVTGLDTQSTYYLVHLHYLGLCLIPPTFFHLFSIFPDRKRILNRWPLLEYVIYIPAVALFMGYQIDHSIFREIAASGSRSWIPNYEDLGFMTRVFMAFCTAGLVTFLLHSIFRASFTQARQRARVILFGVTMAFAPPTIIMASAFLVKFNFPWNFFPFFIIFLPASIAYSIIKHNLFDADVIIKRTVGYAVSTAIVVGAYAVVSIALNVFMGKYQLAQSRAFPILFTLGVILVFNPLRDRIQALVDRLFFRKEYDSGAIVEKVGGAMTSLLDLPKILKQLTQTFIEDMFINTSSVMLVSPDGAQYQISLADGEKKLEVENKILKREEPIIEIIESEKAELTKYDVMEDPKYKTVSESSTANFEALRASLLVPLVYQDKVIGSLNLGEKKSGKPFNREDIELLRTLAHQGAVAIENARLFQENLEKQRMEEELNIARDLQMSMLPAEDPNVEGLDIAAYSVSAREVGGDFYDFIDMGEEKLGLVIADVTGKSVSGALVMSASRSVFRMLSEEHLSVSDSMMRANRRLKKDVKSGMFVALLYAVLNARERTLTLCSAGQTQPILFSAKAGQANLVDTEGDTFPLGILEESSYEETLLQLNPGDMVLFYTDGIVEAMNDDEEIFGFERLLEIVNSAGLMSAESLLKVILEKVNDFTGAAAQHDDLTVIVVSVEGKA
jgi:sigma-B regulation protein RsbU (phosphoserine phosphatase)